MLLESLNIPLSLFCDILVCTIFAGINCKESPHFDLCLWCNVGDTEVNNNAAPKGGFCR